MMAPHSIASIITQWHPDYKSDLNLSRHYRPADRRYADEHPGYNYLWGWYDCGKYDGPQRISLPADISLMGIRDDAIDSVVYALAGADFLRGEVYEPRDLPLAKKEGWIWVRK